MLKLGIELLHNLSLGLRRVACLRNR
jgi:hypothetical protein